jgi:hypothetical protein
MSYKKDIIDPILCVVSYDISLTVGHKYVVLKLGRTRVPRGQFLIGFLRLLKILRLSNISSVGAYISAALCLLKSCPLKCSPILFG